MGAEPKLKISKVNHPQGRVRDLTLILVKRRQYTYSLRLEFRSNPPTPEARKLKRSRVSRKRYACKQRNFQVYLYM